jgi:hypothetical protein
MGNDHEVEFHEIEIQLFQEVEFSIMKNSIISNFDLMINLLVASTIMRSKFKIKHY